MTQILRELVKQKATGKTMSRPLDAQSLALLPDLMQNPAVSAVTKATLVTALLMIATPEEATWTREHIITKQQTCLPTDLYRLFFESSDYYHPLLDHQSLNKPDMLRGLDALFDINEPPEKKAIFLEALRLKEETPLENSVAYQYCLERSHYDTLDIPMVIDLANPYDGFTRHYPVSIALAPALAAVGLPTVLHGTDDCGPKYGLNPAKQLNQLMGNKRRPTAIDSIPVCGWGYSDQSDNCPALYALKQLRIDMVKRPLLATIEKLLMPIRGKKTILVTGYTHPPYKSKMTALMRQSSMHAGILCRGVEGSAQLPLTKRARCLYIDTTGKTDEHFIEATDYPHETTYDNPPDYLTILSGACDHPVYHSVLHTGAMIISHSLSCDYKTAIQQLDHAIKSGEAKRLYTLFLSI